jgi:hypothetical protein
MGQHGINQYTPQKKVTDDFTDDDGTKNYCTVHRYALYRLTILPYYDSIDLDIIFRFQFAN